MVARSISVVCAGMLAAKYVCTRVAVTPWHTYTPLVAQLTPASFCPRGQKALLHYVATDHISLQRWSLRCLQCLAGAEFSNTLVAWR